MSKRKRNLKTLRNVEEALFEAAVVVKTRKKDLLKFPEDVEALHQYRISIRVSRSLVKFLSPYLRRDVALWVKDELKQLQDPTSRMRELDVLVPELDQYPDAQEKVAQAQAAERAAFNEGFDSTETRVSLAAVEEMLRHPQWKGRVAHEGIDGEKLAARIQAMRDECEQTLETVDFDDQEAVHDLRKRAKALRYTARDLAACLPEGAGDVSGRMREVQDKLGEWCDARVGAALVDEICGQQAAELSSSLRARAEGIMEELKASRA